MLVITRKAPETIVGLDADGNKVIEISVVDIDRNQVRIGINTPGDKKQWKFLRGELLEKE